MSETSRWTVRGSRSSEIDRQDQRWSAYVTSSGRQDGDQARDVSAPIPSHQPEGQELWTRTPQSTSLAREQEWSEHVPAVVSRENRSGVNMCPQLSVCQRLRSGMSNLYSHSRSWTHLVWRTVCPIVCGIGGMKTHRNDGKLINGAGMIERPARQRINKIVIGINGAAGNLAMTADFPITTGIGGHPGPPELMMKGGLRGHHGHILLNVSRKSTSTRARLLSGTETSQRRPDEITVEC